jgi:hypothetical protein
MCGEKINLISRPNPLSWFAVCANCGVEMVFTKKEIFNSGDSFELLIDHGNYKKGDRGIVIESEYLDVYYGKGCFIHVKFDGEFYWGSDTHSIREYFIKKIKRDTAEVEHIDKDRINHFNRRVIKK